MSKTIADYTAANSIDASNDYLLIEPSGNTIYKRINRNTLLGLSSAPLGLTDSQSPTNKIFDNTNSLTVKAGSLTIQDTVATTKQAIFSASSITAGQTRTFTFPDASGTLVTTAGTQTLTNKTITSPTLTGGTIDNSTITVDSIAGHTVATTVTVANLQIANGVLNSANAVTSTSIAAGAVQPQALVSGTGSGWTYSSWTPSYTNWTVGTGGSAGTTAKYVQIGKSVFFYIKSTLGTSGFSVGNDAIFTLPVTASASFPVGNIPAGHVTMRAGGVNYGGVLWISDTTHGYPLYYVTNTASATHGGTSSNSPGTWGIGDYFEGWGTYEAA